MPGSRKCSQLFFIIILAAIVGFSLTNDAASDSPDIIFSGKLYCYYDGNIIEISGSAISLDRNNSTDAAGSLTLYDYDTGNKVTAQVISVYRGEAPNYFYWHITAHENECIPGIQQTIFLRLYTDECEAPCRPQIWEVAEVDYETRDGILIHYGIADDFDDKAFHILFQYVAQH